jgi:hypothetical protein
MIVEDFSTLLSPTDCSFMQKVKKETLELNDTIEQMDLTEVYRIFNSATAQYTFFSTTYGTLSKQIIF